MARKIWIVHKSVTMDNKYQVNTFGKRTATKKFKHLTSAKKYANEHANRLKLKSFIYHDANETLRKIKVTGKKRRSK